MKRSGARFTFAIVIIMASSSRGICQTTMPDVLDKGTFTEQMKFLEEKTRIYEDYRAIREDMFQKIKKNSIDSLSKAKGRINGLVTLTSYLNVRIDSLNSKLEATKVELGEVSRTKNSISVMGIQLEKTAYNTTTWTIIAILVSMLVIGYLTFKRNRVITLNTKKEIKDLREEFDEYRKKTRLDREKMSMDHFNEIRKLRGG
jgi:hypothetical protein